MTNFTNLNSKALVSVNGGSIVGIRRPFILVEPPIRITLPVVRPVVCWLRRNTDHELHCN